MVKRLSWEQLVGIEPELATLESDIRVHAEQHKLDENYCANAHWYGYRYRGVDGAGFKDRLVSLVGSESRRGWLIATPEAYDLAYEHLCDLLPPCRNCICISTEEI